MTGAPGINVRLDLEIVSVDLVRGDKPRTNETCAVEGLAKHPLA